MIDILYHEGDSVWRESALKVFTMHATTPDNSKKGKSVNLNLIVTIKEDGNVKIFHKEGITIGECNDLIINGINEIDLRGFYTFATHTAEQFNEMARAARGDVHMKEMNGTIDVVPPAETKAKDKEEKNAERRAKAAAKKKDKVTPINKKDE